MTDGNLHGAPPTADARVVWAALLCSTLAHLLLFSLLIDTRAELARLVGDGGSPAGLHHLGRRMQQTGGATSGGTGTSQIQVGNLGCRKRNGRRKRQTVAEPQSAVPPC